MYFGPVRALHVLLIEVDLLLVLRSHVHQSLRQFGLILLLPPRVHLDQAALIPLPDLLYFLLRRTL